MPTSSVEIEGGDAMLAVSAFECGAAIHRFGCVISHIFIVVESLPRNGYAQNVVGLPTY